MWLRDGASVWLRSYKRLRGYTISELVASVFRRLEMFNRDI